jgi:predicted N-formylglutamate amidohydrolase
MESVETVALIGDLGKAPIWIIADHAGNLIPEGIDLGLTNGQMRTHIAMDMGVAEVAEAMCADKKFAAILGRYSRLLVDLNRDRRDAAAIPVVSDGVAIAGNTLSPDESAARLARYHDSYHDFIAAQLAAHPPKLILSLHSFTPALTADPAQARPWHIGVLYNQQSAPSKRAVALLKQDAKWCVGDQQPYSGVLLNASMNRHAEANHIPYVGIEMRQDCIVDAKGQALFAGTLRKIALKIAEELASGAII